MKRIGRFLSEALFPSSFTCDICGIETFGGNLCLSCLKKVIYNCAPNCPICGRKNVISEICMECKANAPKFKKAVSALIYENGSAVLIAKFKNGHPYLKDYFAELLVERLFEMPELDCIVYVPMTKKAVRKREYNQAELLAKSISKRIDLPVIKNCVIKIKETNEQKSLSRKERAKNLKGCFKVEKASEIKGKRVLLIDDVLTTGATAEAITEKLLKAGADSVYLATVASVEYKLKG